MAKGSTEAQLGDKKDGLMGGKVKDNTIYTKADKTQGSLIGLNPQRYRLSKQNWMYSEQQQNKTQGTHDNKENKENLNKYKISPKLNQDHDPVLILGRCYINCESSLYSTVEK